MIGDGLGHCVTLLFVELMVVACFPWLLSGSAVIVEFLVVACFPWLLAFELFGGDILLKQIWPRCGFTRHPKLNVQHVWN